MDKEQALIGLNSGLLSYDWNETRSRVAQKGGKENNPILGEKPSPSKLNAYFAGVALLGGVAVNALPEKLRAPALAAAAAIQYGSLKGLFGGYDMTKPKDKNSIPIALGASALGAGIGHILSDDSVSVVPMKDDGAMGMAIRYNKKF